jgi:hypothetical protein
MAVGDDHPGPEAPLESREPSLEDLVELCQHLNAQGSRCPKSRARHSASTCVPTTHIDSNIFARR